MNIRIRVNTDSIDRKYKKVIQTKGYKIAYDRAYSNFYRAKQKFLEQFNEHPVTVELEAGSTSPVSTPNISNTLDGYGNLFSFIGFTKGDNPIVPLRQLFENQIKFRFSSFREGKWYFSISYPDWGDIEDKSKMPWEQGNSWAKAIENGMSNLSYYLNKKGGRSGGGIMIKDLAFEVNEDLTFHPVDYLTEILDNFKQKIKNSK